MKKNNPVIHFILIITFILLQSTVLGKIKFLPYFPDLAFVILVFSSISLGSARAQTIGFFSGLVLDVLSNSSFGFFALIYTLTGFILGKMKGKFFIDPVLVPILITLVCCVFRALSASIIASVFLQDARFFSNAFLIESGLDLVAAPIVIALMKLFRVLTFLDQDHSL